MHRAPDADSDLLLSCFFISILDLPDVVVISNSVYDLVFILNEWIFFLELPGLSNIS